MSRSRKASPSQPNTSPREIPAHLLPVWETLSRMSATDAWRLGAPIILSLGVVEPTIFYGRSEPEEIGLRFLSAIEPNEHWFAVAEHMGQAQQDPHMIAIALVRIAAVGLVGA